MEQRAADIKTVIAAADDDDYNDEDAEIRLQMIR